jgi:hypothetical protein
VTENANAALVTAIIISGAYPLARPKRARHNQKKDRRDILKDEDGGGR